MSLPLCRPLWQYALRFRERCSLIASRARLNWKILGCCAALERLYLVAAVALLYSTTKVWQYKLRVYVDPHWQRGLSYLKIGLRWR